MTNRTTGGLRCPGCGREVPQYFTGTDSRTYCEFCKLRRHQSTAKATFLNCGHPFACLSDPAPDFYGDDPRTMKVGTVYCRWCAEVGNLKARIKELEEELKSREQ